MNLPDNVTDIVEQRYRTRVFDDRSQAGQVLAELLAPLASAKPIVVAVPYGGIEVAVPIAAMLDAPLHVGRIAKLVSPWQPDHPYGALIADGSQRLNDDLVAHLGMSSHEMHAELHRARTELIDIDALAGAPLPALAGRPIIVVDDGMASGTTLTAMLDELSAAGADQFVVAIPTAHLAAVRHLAREVDRVVCPNLRSGASLSIADSYRVWTDADRDSAARAMSATPLAPQRTRRATTPPSANDARDNLRYAIS